MEQMHVALSSSSSSCVAGQFCQALHCSFVALPGSPALLLSQCHAPLETLQLTPCTLAVTFCRKDEDLRRTLCCEQTTAYACPY